MGQITVICPACGAQFDLPEEPSPEEIIECPICKVRIAFNLYKQI